MLGRGAEYGIGEWCAEDRGSILACFERAFGGEAAARKGRSFDWEYLEGPMRAWGHVARTRRGDVAALYATQPARAWGAGGGRVLAQVIDSMVDPEHRAGLKRPGLFVNTAQRFFEVHGDPNAIYYGWPLPEAWRVGERFLDYGLIGPWNLLIRELGEGRVEVPGVRVLESFDHRAGWLWERCADEMRLSIVRDAERLRWRYLDAPGKPYVCMGVPDGAGNLGGLAVLREEWRAGVAALVDWVVPTDEPEVGEDLRRAVEARARGAGAGALAVALPSWSRWFDHFVGRDYLVHPSDYLLVARSFDRRFDLDDLREGLWLGLGDSDLA